MSHPAYSKKLPLAPGELTSTLDETLDDTVIYDAGKDPLCVTPRRVPILRKPQGVAELIVINAN